jgi:sec-independent protein translocase protein TatA
MISNFGILDLGTPELIIILAIILLLFGSKNLPKLSRSVGDSIRELRKGFSDETKESKPDDKNSKSPSKKSDR